MTIDKQNANAGVDEAMVDAAVEVYLNGDDFSMAKQGARDLARAVLEAALAAQPAKPEAEPDAWMYDRLSANGVNWITCVTPVNPSTIQFKIRNIRPLYLHPDAGQWRDIESAPKDGTKIDLGSLRRNGRFVRAPDCHWHKKAKRWMCKWNHKDGWSAIRAPFEPTHWMPLPAPPSQPGEAHDQQS